MIKLINTGFEGLYVIEPSVYCDDRGYFMESFNQKEFSDSIEGYPRMFVQDNESCSNKGTLRGLHFQLGASAQSKLVRVVKGMVLDVVLDMRIDSVTYGEVFSVLLSGENKKQLYVPRGFAHGFSVLEDNTIFNYKCDNFYNKQKEYGFNAFSPSLNIDWNLKPEEVIMSDKDKNWKNFEK